jgi:transcriptional regulator with PAS, ATPase and Fis domain
VFECNMKLAGIKEDADKFCEVISKTLDVDVLIVDNGMKTVSNTLRYFDKFPVVSSTSVVARVLKTGEVVALPDRNQCKSCQSCPDFKECEMGGFIGVPVSYQNEVVGAIALVLPERRVSQVFADEHSSVEFVKNMADLLSSKIRNHEEYDELNVIRRDREVLIDTIEDGIAATDNIGLITYYNRHFQSQFNLSKDVKGKRIWEVIPHRFLKDYWEKTIEISDQPLLVDLGGNRFYGTVSCRPVNTNSIRSGVIFRFRSLTSVSREMNATRYNKAHVSFRWENQRLFSEKVEEEAKRLAVTNSTILIEGEDGTGKDILAQCIHRFSNRNNKPFVTLDCNPMYREQLDEMLFGDFGNLHMAHTGTLYIRNVDQLPLYLQDRLVEFLCRGTLYPNSANGELKLDLRFIFSSKIDLSKRAVGNGYFNDELYYRISQHILQLPPLRENKPLLFRIIPQALRFYASCNGTAESVLESDAMEQLAKYDWPGNLVEAEYVLEQLAVCGKARIHAKDLKKMELLQSYEVKSISEIEREKIAELLKQYPNKDDVAKLLGISRATLYRKIKSYNLKEKENISYD